MGYASHMMVDHKAAALEELRSERDALVAQATGLRAELDGINARVGQLNTVIEPLEALVSGATSIPPTAAANGAAANDVTGLRAVVTTGEIPEVDDRQDVPEVFKRYLPRGGEGKRLRSTLMVSDVVEMIGEPVTKEMLRRRFFDHFGRDNLARFWERPDNALNTAIGRAIEEQLITRVPDAAGGADLYTGGPAVVYAGHFGVEEDN